jgi:transposase
MAVEPTQKRSSAMSTIPTSVTEKQFEVHIEPHLTVAKRGYVSKIPLYKMFNYILKKLYTGCQWKELPIDPDPNDPDKKEISWHAVYYHYRKWSRDGSLEKVWKGSILTISSDLNLSELNLDGSHVIAKKGGESVAYQGRKKAKTTNILPISDRNGFFIASTGLIAGNHNDAYNLKSHLQSAFKSMKKLGLDFQGAFFNADKAFDTKDARKTCFNHAVIPNIDENKRNRKDPKRGRKRFFDPEIYKNRFVAERSFAWADKFKALLIRFDRKDAFFLGAHFIVFAMINLRHILCQ